MKIWNIYWSQISFLLGKNIMTNHWNYIANNKNNISLDYITIQSWPKESILTVVLISFRIFNIIFNSRAICGLKNKEQTTVPPLVQLNMKSILSPDLMLNLRFPFIPFQIYCMSINSTAETSKLWLVTSVYKLNFIWDESQPFIELLSMAIFTLEHQNWVVARNLMVSKA